MRLVIAAVVLAFVALLPPGEEVRFGDWSTPVSLGSVVNSTVMDACVTISKDGRSLFFSSTRNAVADPWDRDLFVSHRASVNDAWTTPQPLAALNTPAWEACPTLSLDEHKLLFTSPSPSRPGGCGAWPMGDMWVSRRQDRANDFAWEPAVNLGCDPDGPNTPFNDITPALFEDEAGKTWLYFSSNRLGAQTGNWNNSDFFQSEMNEDGTFGPASPVAELNSPYSDYGITVRRDGLEVIFMSNRPGTASTTALDFWMATRATTAEPWSPPVRIDSLGAANGEGKISLSFDGRELYFASYNVSWNPVTVGTYPHLWVAKRERLRGPKP